MRIYRVGFALGVAAAVAISGCSNDRSSLGIIAQHSPIGSSQSVVRNHVPVIVPAASLSIHQSPRLMTKSWATPDMRGTLLVYACTYASSFCEWFNLDLNVVRGQITNLTYPQGIGVDSAGNVWVANTGASDVLVFAKASTTVIETLDDPGQFPVGVAIDSDGTAYVANIFDTSFGAGSVSVYAPGATTPTRMLTDPNFNQVISVAVDEHHRAIVCYNGTDGGQCDEFPHGVGHGVTKLTGLFSPGGVAFDDTENIVVSDQTRAFDVFHPKLFSNCASTSMGTTDEVMLALSQNNKRLIASNTTQGTLDEFPYSSCSGGVGASNHAYTVGTASDVVVGAAYDPATTP